jgi:AbrB family looped-hinge helix DNA binding protein
MYGMKLRMDNAGRIVIPKPLRKRLGLNKAAELEVVEQSDGILLRRAKLKPSMVRVNGIWVHQGKAEPGTNWDRLVDDVREERIRDILGLQ